MKLLLATLLLAAVPATAPAEPLNITRSVATADLDLSSAAGQRALDHRLTVAIADACGEASATDLSGHNAVRACRVEARARVDAGREQRLAAHKRAGATALAAR